MGRTSFGIQDWTLLNLHTVYEENMNIAAGGLESYRQIFVLFSVDYFFFCNDGFLAESTRTQELHVHWRKFAPTAAFITHALFQKPWNTRNPNNHKSVLFVSLNARLGCCF